MAGICLSLLFGLLKETVGCLWKMVEILTCHVRPHSIAAEAILGYILTSQSQQGVASQLEAKSHTPLTVPLPPGKDSVAV